MSTVQMLREYFLKEFFGELLFVQMRSELFLYGLILYPSIVTAQVLCSGHV